MSRKSSAIVLSYLLIVIDVLVGILLVPYILRSLGDYQYGVYKLMLSTASYLGLLDFGLGGTITRYIVKYRTEGKEKEKENFMAMGLVIYGLLAVLLMLLAFAVCLFIPRMYQASIDAADMRMAQIIFMLMCSTTAMRLFSHAYNGLFAAYERFTYTKGANILKVCARVALIFVGLYFIKSAVVVAFIDFALTLILLLINVVYARAALKFRIKLHYWDGAVAKEAGVFTLAILGQAIINQFNSNVDTVVLGIFTTASVITMYSISLQLFTMYSNLSTAVSTVFLPSISKSVFQGASDEEITEKIIAPSRMQLMILLLALSGFVLFGKEFIGVWVGDGYTLAYYLGLVLLTTSTIELSQTTISSVLKAKNKLHGKTLILGVSTLINAVITVALVPRFGALGAVAGTAFSLIFGYGLALSLYYHYKIGIRMGTYYKKTYKGIWLAVLLALLSGQALNYLMPVGTWFWFAVKAGVYCAVYAVFLYLFGMNKDEKSYVTRFSRKIRRK